MECSTYLLGELYCNATFDVQCWNFTLAGTTARGACPENHQFSILFDDPEGKEIHLTEHYLMRHEDFVLIKKIHTVSNQSKKYTDF